MAKQVSIQIYDDQVKDFEENEDEIQDIVQYLLEKPEKIKEFLEDY